MLREKFNIEESAIELLAKIKFFKSEFWYEIVMRGMEKIGGQFANFGYLPINEEILLKLNADDEINRLHINLVEKALVELVVNGKDILVLGCGMGGDAEYIGKYKNPKQVLGIDRSKRAVEYARKANKLANVQFIQDKVEDLKVDSMDRFDIIVSIESSHCFDQEALLDKTSQLLKPGGVLAIVDFRDRKSKEKLLLSIESRGLQIVKNQDISANIILSMEEESDNRQKTIEEVMPKTLQVITGEFIGLRGSRIHNLLKSGKVEYFVLQVSTKSA